MALTAAANFFKIKYDIIHNELFLISQCICLLKTQFKENILYTKLFQPIIII